MSKRRAHVMAMFWLHILHIVNLFLIMVANVVNWHYLKILKKRFINLFQTARNSLTS